MMTPVSELANNTALLIVGAQNLQGLESVITQVDGCWIWRPTLAGIEHVDAAGKVGDVPQELSPEAMDVLKRIVAQQPSIEDGIAAIVAREFSSLSRDLIAASKKAPQFGRKPKKTKQAAGDTSRADGLKAGTAAALLVDMICREEGATNKELCDAVGWTQCLPALKKYAAKAGVVITVKKEGDKPTRYFGARPAPVPPAAAPTEDQQTYESGETPAIVLQ